jgi:hypothetical protein
MPHTHERGPFVKQLHTDPHSLMKFGTSAADGFTATKRVYQGQQRMIESPNNPNSTGL